MSRADPHRPAPTRGEVLHLLGPLLTQRRRAPPPSPPTQQPQGGHSRVGVVTVGARGTERGRAAGRATETEMGHTCRRGGLLHMRPVPLVRAPPSPRPPSFLLLPRIIREWASKRLRRRGAGRQGGWEGRVALAGTGWGRWRDGGGGVAVTTRHAAPCRLLWWHGVARRGPAGRLSPGLLLPEPSRGEHHLWRAARAVPSRAARPEPSRVVRSAASSSAPSGKDPHTRCYLAARTPSVTSCASRLDDGGAAGDLPSTVTTVSASSSTSSSPTVQ